MEKTIKAEMKRKIICSELLNENSLLVVSKGENDANPILSVRYVEQDVIKEDEIASFIPTMLFQYNERVIGVFVQNATDEINNSLDIVYDLEKHALVEHDLQNSVYYSRANEDKPMQYIKSPNS